MIDTNVLIKFIDHLRIIENRYVRTGYDDRTIEEAGYFTPQELREIEKLIQADLGKSRGEMRNGLMAKLKLREKIKKYLGATYLMLSKRHLTPYQKSDIKNYLEKWHNWNGLDARQLAKQMSLGEARNLINSLKVSKTRGSRGIIAENARGIKPIVNRFDIGKPWKQRRVLRK